MIDLLIKYASRSRPEKFKSTLALFMDRLSRKRTVRILVSLDENDEAMNTPAMHEHLMHCSSQMAHGSELVWYFGQSTGKHHAMNRDIDRFRDWRVICVAQDDVYPVVMGYDDAMVGDMDLYWPDGDGCMFYRDGLRTDDLCTMSVMGRTYFDRFGYIYNPCYVSLYADNEHTDVANSLGKLRKIERVLLAHDWHSPDVQDAMRKQTESWYAVDGATYSARKAADFPKEWPVKQ